MANNLLHLSYSDGERVNGKSIKHVQDVAIHLLALSIEDVELQVLSVISADGPSLRCRRGRDNIRFCHVSCNLHLC